MTNGEKFINMITRWLGAVFVSWIFTSAIFGWVFTDWNELAQSVWIILMVLIVCYAKILERLDRLLEKIK